MPSLAKLVANRAPATIDFGAAGALHVEYFPARLTGRMMQDLIRIDHLTDLSAEQAVSVIGSPAEALVSLLASWDLTAADADGIERVLPIDRPTIEGLGFAIQMGILLGLASAQAGEAKGEAAAPEA